MKQDGLYSKKSGANVDKTEAVTYSRAQNGVIYIAEETNAYLSPCAHDHVMRIIFLVYCHHDAVWLGCHL